MVQNKSIYLFQNDSMSHAILEEVISLTLYHLEVAWSLGLASHGCEDSLGGDFYAFGISSLPQTIY